jgi:hypothetical protein
MLIKTNLQKKAPTVFQRFYCRSVGPICQSTADKLMQTRKLNL